MIDIFNEGLNEEMVTEVLSTREQTMREIMEKLECRHKKEFTWGVLYLIVGRLEKQGIVFIKFPETQTKPRTPMKVRLTGTKKSESKDAIGIMKPVFV